jgi:twitching motility protein PilT
VFNFEQLLKSGVDQGATAIHLQAETAPQLRIGGVLKSVDVPPVNAEELRAFIASIGPKSVDDDFDRQLPLGSKFSTSVGTGRFRCATFSHIRGPGLVLRVIPPSIRTTEELQLPQAVRELALARRGLVLIVGPSGSGKTTTLTAMVDLINSTCFQKVVTIEAPVEYLHANKKAMITQMEVGLNASSFEHGLSLALQQDPDVIVISDLRDSEVVRMALGAAEAGRKVLANMTGLYAIQAVSRLISLILPAEGDAAASRLAAALEGVIAQRLVTTREGKPRTAVEILRGGIITSKAIQEDRLKDLVHIMEGRQGGMQSLDQHLVELHHSRVISGTEAMRLASNPEAVGEGLRTSRPAGPDQNRPPSGIIDIPQTSTP